MRASMDVEANPIANNATGVLRSLESVTIARGNREATLNGHLSPSCKEMTVEFSLFPAVVFD
jgi:hypothetical protein